MNVRLETILFTDEEMETIHQFLVEANIFDNDTLLTDEEGEYCDFFHIAVEKWMDEEIFSSKEGNETVKNLLLSKIENKTEDEDIYKIIYCGANNLYVVCLISDKAPF